MTAAELLAISREKNTSAFLWVIRACEGTAGNNGYSMLFGKELFTSFKDHPRKLIIKDGYRSTAAGAYQFIESTWDETRLKYGIPDFSPQSQDIAAVARIVYRKALDAVRAGDLDTAIDRCNNEWASFPGSPHGQPVRDMAFVRKIWALHGGSLKENSQNLAADTRPNDAFRGFDTAPQQPANQPPQRKPMGPFVIPALSILAELVPSIAKLFKGEAPSAVAERNVAAFEQVVDKLSPLLLQATGAPNLQGAVEQAQASPAVVAAIDEAVQKQYFALLDASEKSTSAARDFAVQYAAMTNVRTVIGRFTFLEVLTLVLLAISAGLTGWLIYADLLKGELLGAVVTLVVVAGFVDVRKFWLGLPAPDQPKK